jgi:hypothetical protein
MLANSRDSAIIHTPADVGWGQRHCFMYRLQDMMMLTIEMHFKLVDSPRWSICANTTFEHIHTFIEFFMLFHLPRTLMHTSNCV